MDGKISPRNISADTTFILVRDENFISRSRKPFQSGMRFILQLDGRN